MSRKHTSKLLAVIFDVDGVLVASPHERAWREALVDFADPAQFTTEFYQSHVAGKPRLDGARATLENLDVPDADLSGTDVPRGKPDPALFLLAAKVLETPPAACLVVEDAPAGIAAARAAGMATLGIARLGDETLLRSALADLVVTSLDHVDTAAIAEGILRTRGQSENSANA